MLQEWPPVKIQKCGFRLLYRQVKEPKCKWKLACISPEPSVWLGAIFFWKMYLRIDRALVLFTWSIQTFWQINCHLPRQSPGPSSGKKLSTISSLTKHSYNRENHLNSNWPSPSNRENQKAAINISKALNPEVTKLKESFWQVLEMPVVSEAPGQPTPHLIYSTSVFCRAPDCGYQLVIYFINSPKMPLLGWGKDINIVHSWKRRIDFNYGKADRGTCTPGFNYSCQHSNDFKNKLGGTSSSA